MFGCEWFYRLEELVNKERKAEEDEKIGGEGKC